MKAKRQTEAVLNSATSLDGSGGHVSRIMMRKTTLASRGIGVIPNTARAKSSEQNNTML
jgi:hypothetical protein